MAIFYCQKIKINDYKILRKLKRENIDSTLMIFDFSCVSNDIELYQSIKYITKIKTFVMSKYGLKLKFCINNIGAVVKYNILELVNIEPLFVSLTGNFSNKIIGTKLDDGELTEFGKYVVTKLDDNKILIEISKLSENGFFELANILNTPMICNISYSKKFIDVLDYQKKIIVEQKGYFIFDFQLKFKKRNINNFCQFINRHIELYGSDNIKICSSKNLRLKNRKLFEHCLFNEFQYLGYSKNSLNF